MKRLLPNMTSRRRVWLTIGQVLILSSFVATGETNSHAETIWVEAETKILSRIDTHHAPGGTFTGTLIDDLHQPLPNARIRLIVSGERSHKTFEFDIVTSPDGAAQTALGLKPDHYEGYAEFAGSETYRPAREAIRFDIDRCRLETRLVPAFPQLIPVGEKVSFDLVRQNCTTAAADYVLIQNDTALDIRLDPGQETVALELDARDGRPGVLSFSIELLAGNNFEPETLRGDIYYYDALSAQPPSVEYGMLIPRISAQLSGNVKGIPVELVLSNGSGHEVTMASASDDRGTVHFEPPGDVSGCYHASMRRTDKWEQAGAFEGEICFGMPRTRYFLPIAGICVLCATLIFMSYRPKRRKHKLPKTPERHGLAAQTAPLPNEDGRIIEPANGRTEITCIDAQTGDPISPSDVEIITKDGAFRPDAWPFALAGDLEKIESKDYIAWSGKVRRRGRNLVPMTKRRNYVIQCFESVCEAYDEDLKPWGHETPLQLARAIQSRAKSKETRADADKFGELVSSAVFDSKHIDDSALKDIRELAQKLLRGR